jgi:two-component system OmpR family sensor kinase/two-component system phosphate regulon sensor histidine kinase PhoR
MTIKRRLFVYYLILFTVFTLSILVFQNYREKRFRMEELENRLNEYALLVDRFITGNGLHQSGEFASLDSLKKLVLPDEIRLTVLSFSGDVLYDNSVAAYSRMENHARRPEFVRALREDKGTNIRHSVTTDQNYFYYAKKINGLIIRTAMVYDIELRNFLKTEGVFLGFLVLLFSVFGILLYIMAGKIGDSVTKLKDFIIKVNRNESVPGDLVFPNDELGTISNEITQLYDQARKAQSELVLEKEKLISHLFVLREGVAFFSPQKEVILHNSHFIVFAKIISGEASFSIDRIFSMDAFSDVTAFVDQLLGDPDAFNMNELPRREYTIHHEGFHFQLQSIFFPDKSFEILITDNTHQMKRSIMKQQLTSNIAHELKTPIASVKGYLETVLNNPGLEKSKVRYFVDKAYRQTERLSQLVSDIALLNKIEESSELYPKEKLSVCAVFHDVVDSLSDEINSKKIVVKNLISENITVHANYSLLFSVFRNLLENSVNYGGEEITVVLSSYHEDANYHYCSFSDDGAGVDDEHLPRIFERFYRVDSGRSRIMGGTGLGLAIVKNAILSFRGEVTARKRQGGGLEFFFSLPK